MMRVSKFVTATAATATIVGAIGLVYAQTSPYNSSGAPTNPQTQNQSQAPGQSGASSPSMQTPAPSSPSSSANESVSKGGSTAGSSGSSAPTAAGAAPRDAGSMAGERVAQADRG